MQVYVGQWRSPWPSETRPHTLGRWCSPPRCSSSSSQSGSLAVAQLQCCPGCISGNKAHSHTLTAPLPEPDVSYEFAHQAQHILVKYHRLCLVKFPVKRTNAVRPSKVFCIEHFDSVLNITRTLYIKYIYIHASPLPECVSFFSKYASKKQCLANFVQSLLLMFAPVFFYIYLKRVSPALFSSWLWLCSSIVLPSRWGQRESSALAVVSLVDCSKIIPTFGNLGRVSAP